MQTVLGHQVRFVDHNAKNEWSVVECDGHVGNPTDVMPIEVQQWFKDQPHLGGVTCPKIKFDGQLYTLAHWAYNAEELEHYNAHRSSRSGGGTSAYKGPSSGDFEVKKLILAAFEKSPDSGRVSELLNKLIPELTPEQKEELEIREKMAELQAKLTKLKKKA